jgi:hypothetical protein
VRIPLTSCNQAADVLVEWFGPHELKTVVGGERWWQVRGLDGIDGEWITQKQFLHSAQFDPERKLDESEQTILRMDNIQPVMVRLQTSPYQA